ncbi:MAG TPA: hypothetical protein VN363_05795 [Anaerolineales bacterium]|nr:hypothetical protein [Anaerolineales bacterium]
MSYTLILHVMNEEPIVGEVENLPDKADNLVMVRNPRRLDGKDLPYLADNVTSVYWPVSRLNFIEIISGREEEEIIGFVRE